MAARDRRGGNGTVGRGLPAGLADAYNAKGKADKSRSEESLKLITPPSRPARAATMQDIADALGISQSTVSRVLTGAPMPVPINPVTRQRVLDMARQLHYRPNPLARGLRGAKTMLLGLIVREITDPFWAGVIDAISAEASKRGYNVVLGHAHGRADEAIALRAVLETRHCDAIIILGDTSDQPRLIEDLHDADATVVGVLQGSAAVPGVPSIDVDNRFGMMAILDHLVGLGHRSFGFIGGSFSFAGGRTLGDIGERQSAFVEGLAERGIHIKPEYLRGVYNNYSGGANGLEELMALPNPPTAVVASTDMLAIGALRAADRMGLDVPSRISIVGFDDLPLAEHVNPPLTTVRQPISEIAAAAVGAAIDKATTGAEPSQMNLSLQPTLVVRESSGPAPQGR